MRSSLSTLRSSLDNWKEMFCRLDNDLLILCNLHRQIVRHFLQLKSHALKDPSLSSHCRGNSFVVLHYRLIVVQDFLGELFVARYRGPIPLIRVVAPPGSEPLVPSLRGELLISSLSVIEFQKLAVS